MPEKTKTMSAEVFTVKSQNEETEKNITEKSFFHIDREMLRFKIHYFLFIGGTASVNPFLPIVGKNRIGLSATSMASILAVQQLITVVSKPIIGYIADYFNRLKLMINTLLIIQIIFLFLILAIPPIKKSSTSLQEMQSFNQFINLNEQPELTILIARYNLNSSSETTYSNPLQKSEDIWSAENSSFVEILCILHINLTEIICFRDKIGDEMTNFNLESELNCACSVNFLHSVNLSDSLQHYDQKFYFHLSSLESNDSVYEINKTFPCKIALHKDNVFSTVANAISEINDFQTAEFWMFAVVNIIAGICTSSIFTLSDTACSESVQKLGGDFGRQRLFGAVGWGTLAAVSGFLCDITGNYFASWIFMAVLQVIALWNISQLYLIKPHFSQNLLKDIGRVLKSLEFAAFELGVFFNGIGAGILWFYLIWFISGLGASKFLCGLTQYVECFLGEIPFMFFSGWFIKKLGHFNLLSLSLLSYALRFLWYSYLQNPWLVLPAEITHGFTYGTLFPTIASYGKLSAKPGTEATTQSILFTTHGGLGAGFGCILSGICFDQIGAHQTFFYLSLVCFCGTILNFVNTLLFKRRNTENFNLPLDSNPR